MYLYDKINATKKLDDIHSEIFTVLGTNIILKEYILPKKSSQFLCKTFIEAIEKIKYDFPTFQFYTTCLHSPKFVKYLLYKDIYFINQYISFWERNGTIAQIGDLLDIFSVLHKCDPQNAISKRLEHHASDIDFKYDLDNLYQDKESEIYKYLLNMIWNHRYN